MTCARRFLFVLLLMLVLPFQGGASAALACAHGPDRPAPVATAGTVAMTHDAAVTAAPDAVRHGVAPVHPASCAACHACCVGAVLPPVAAQGVPRVRVPSTVFPDDAGGPVLFLTGGIERPPRS